jgi:hypothetical protein
MRRIGKRGGAGRSHASPEYGSFANEARLIHDWKPTVPKMEGPDKSGRFETKLILDAGTREYKSVLEGTRWRHDPGNRRQAGFYHNSVLELGKAR